MFIFPETTKAQEYHKREIDLNEFIEDMSQESDEAVDYTDLYDLFSGYYQSPINLNLTNREELSSLMILSELQLTSFFSYRDKNGDFLSIYEIQAVPNFDLNTIQKILPFVMVPEQGISMGSQNIFKRIKDGDDNWVVFRYMKGLEEQPQYNEKDSLKRFLGSPNRTYARVNLRHPNDYSIGITTEKDAGEQFKWDPKNKRYGMDYYSAHLHFYNKGHFKAIALGDYNMHIGQGVILSTGFAKGKSAETVSSIRKSHLGVKPYASVMESGFLRGAAVTYGIGPVDLTSFYSRNKYDGRLNEITDTLDQEAAFFVSSFDEEGVHRNINELNRKGRITDQTYGGNVSYYALSRTLRIGLTYVNTQYSDSSGNPVKIIPTPRVYNQYYFKGSQNRIYGGDYSYNLRNFTFFGEIARSDSGGIGLVNGIVASVSKEVELAWLYRSYDRNFHTLYGAPIAESSRPMNETGHYWGVKVSPNKKWILAGYYDWFQFPWLRSSAYAPSDGTETLTRITYMPGKNSTMYVHFKNEFKPRNATNTTSNLNLLTDRSSRNYRIHLDYKLPGSHINKISFASRVDVVERIDGEEDPSYGFWVHQDFNFEIGKFVFSTRYAIFDANNLVIYTFEKQVLLYSYNPSFYGRGTRTYVMIRYRMMRGLNLWVRYALTNEQTHPITLAPNEIGNGPTKTDVTVQVKYDF